MMTWLKSIGSELWAVFAVLLAVIVGGLMLFYRGKGAGRADAQADDAKGEASKVKAAGKSGDAAEVLRSFRRATDKERK